MKEETEDVIQYHNVIINNRANLDDRFIEFSTIND